MTTLWLWGQPVRPAQPASCRLSRARAGAPSSVRAAPTPRVLMPAGGTRSEPAFARISSCARHPKSRARREHTAWNPEPLILGLGSRSPRVPVTLALAGCLLTHVSLDSLALNQRAALRHRELLQIRTRLS